jgi:head-to-tail connecting protein
MATDLPTLVPQYQRAKNRWLETAGRLQEIAEFLLPYQSNLTMFGGTEGRKKTQRLYHARGIRAADRLARAMHGSVTPDAMEWHSPVMRAPELNKLRPVRAWLQDCSQRLYAARRQSNFSMAIGRFYSSFCALATAGLYVEEKPTTRPGVFGGLQYHFLPLGTFYVEQSGDEVIDTVYRDLRWPLRSVAARFGLGPLRQAFTDLDERLRTKPDEEIEFVHAMYPRRLRDPRVNTTRNWPLASCFFLPQGQPGAVLLSESGLREPAAMVGRWDVAQREVWGTGLGHLAYPDVRSLNKVRELKLMAGGTAVYPPTIRTQRVLLTEASIQPGASMVRSEEFPNLPALEAFDTKAKFNVAELLEADMERAIDDMYYVADLLLPEGGRQMTAYEVEKRVQEKQALLGPTMGRLVSELLMPLFTREFALMSRAGAFAPPPPELLEALEAGQADLDVEWEGPLARAQRAYELVAIDRQMEGTAALASVHPELWDLYDLDAQERRRSEITGYPADIMRDPHIVQQIRQGRAEQQAQQARAAALAQIAESAGKAAPALKLITGDKQQDVA